MITPEFRRHVARMMTRDFPQLSAIAEPLFALLDTDGFDSPKVRALLRDTGLRAAWNESLDHRRPQRLAPELAPLLFGRAVDVLAGTGSLTRTLVQHGVDLTGFEESHAYPGPMPACVRPIEELDSVGHADSALLCTVLHHEPHPLALLDSLSRLDCKSWVVVENCLLPGITDEFHREMDIFFNCSLNNFDVACTASHLSPAAWLEMLRPYGSVRHVTRVVDVPGIPFPYDVFQVITD